MRKILPFIRPGVEAALVCVLIGACVLFPQAHFGYSTQILDMGDEGLLWYVSQRTALGDVPLRDSFSYDPGRYYWSAFIFKVLRGDGLFEQIVADDLFGLVSLFIIYTLMCKLSIDRRRRIITILLLGIAMGFPRHKIYEQALSLVAVAGVTLLLSRPVVKCWFAYGVCTGVAAFMGRNSGLYFVIAALLAAGMSQILRLEVSARRTLGAYLAGVAIGYLPMFVMLVSVKGFPSALWRSILLNSKQLIPVPVPFPWRLHALGLHGPHALGVSILFIAVPLTYAALLLLLPRLGSGSDHSNERMLAYGASIAGAPYLFHAFSYARFGHLAQASLPFVVGSTALSAYFSRSTKQVLSLCVLVGLTGLVLTCWLPREPALEYFRARDRYKPIQIQNTQFLLLSEDADLLRAAQIGFQRCGGRDGSFLASPTYPSPYAFLRTRSPFWEVYFILFRLAPSEESQSKHVAALIQNQTSLILLDQADKHAMSVLYPKLLDYVSTHYQPMDTGVPTGDSQMYYAPELCHK